MLKNKNKEEKNKKYKTMRASAFKGLHLPRV